MTPLPTDRSLFPERALLKLLELSGRYKGVLAIQNLERARRFGLLNRFRDVGEMACKLINDLDSAKDLETALVRAFWAEMGSQVTLPTVSARISIGMPPTVKSNAEVAFELVNKHPNANSANLPYLRLAPFAIKGSTPGFADDITIFDIVPTDGLPNPLDLRPLTQFITAGTTISVYFPAEQHSEWFTWARPMQLPPVFILDKHVELVFSKQISPDVVTCVYGVEPAARLKS